MNVLFIGCGLIGGSIAKVLTGKAEIYTLTQKKISYNGIKSFVNANEIPNVEFEIICIATPRGKNFEIYTNAFEIAEKFSTAKTKIVDISSVQNQNEAFQKKYPNFTPCHPIAGTEKTGFENSSPQIITGKNCIIISRNPPQKVLDFWQNAGMQSVFMESVQKHDEIFAKISHLPQFLSFAMQKRNGFEDFYRLTTSPISIWQETFSHNKKNICNALNLFQEAFLAIKSEHFCFEKLVSQTFLNFTNKQEKSFSGSGFKSITSAFNANKYIQDETKMVENLIEKSHNFLAQF